MIQALLTIGSSTGGVLGQLSMLTLVFRLQGVLLPDQRTQADIYTHATDKHARRH